jgi:hypothetical protein
MCCKPASKIVIFKDDMQTFNPTEEMLLDDGWIIHIPENTEPSDEERLYMAKRDKIRDIEYFDKSQEVEEFTINGISLWLDRSERETLDRRFRIELKNDKTESVLWKNGIAFPLVIKEALVMLDTIEMYAIATYDRTQQHIANVNKLESIEEIKDYDYREGYPDKLIFNTNILDED